MESFIFPASFAQQRLWFLDQLYPNGSVYNIAFAFRAETRLDLSTLEQSVNEIVKRHESLRTTFTTVDGTPMQVIAREQHLKLKVLDLSQLGLDQRDAEVQRLSLEEAERPFDLATGPLLRITLLRLTAAEDVVLITMHHIITDGWSCRVFLRELATLYEGFRTRQASSLPELPIQYADYAAWQRELLETESLQKQFEYWKVYLSGAPAVLELGADRTRPPVQSFRGGRRHRKLPVILAARLRELSRSEGATLFMTLLAAFDVLLWRYSGQHDVVVGTPIAARSLSDLEGLIGFFANTLALRVDLSGNPKFSELLSRVREVAVEAYAHQDAPFDKIVEELQPERSLSYTPIFQVMLAYEKATQDELNFGQTPLHRLSVDRQIAKFDLTLYVEDAADGEISCTLEYNDDLFDAVSIERMISHYENLLEAIVENSEEHIGELRLLEDSERRQLLRDWNDTRVDYPGVQCIHLLFEAQVEKSGDATAVVFEDQTLSYQELNERANQLAHYLRKRGVGPDALVGVFMERSLDLVVALFAVLKAGGAYVPLDPGYPSERLAFMVEDGDMSTIITSAKSRDLVPADLDWIALDTDWPAIATESDSNLPAITALDNLAYVIYTSGSTGKPKGTTNTHRGLCNRLYWMQQAYELTEADRVLQKTPFSFDVSVWEFFWPLIAGARLVVAQPGGHQDPAYLVNVIQEQGITTLHFVPSMLQVFLDEEDVQSCKSVRRVISSGEALPFDLQERFFSRMKAKLHNLYGPTEASIDVTSWECRNADFRGVVPIGYPIANTQLHVLSEFLQPAPINVAGELYIGGVGLGRGYLKRADLTAEKFVPDPFSEKQGARLYRTGDLARYRADGAIEYLGRTDHQVKVRGFRIELGEIESVLARHASVKECAVVARMERRGSSIAAYIVPANNQNISLEELRRFLNTNLPEYMIPATFHTLDTFPLTPNGKVDRRALPETGRLGFEQDKVHVDARTPVEMTLAKIWANILGLDQVGIHDNFFELGGDSILSIQIISRARKAGIQLAPKQIFQHQTIAELATVADTAKFIQAEQGLVTGPVPLTPVQHWLIEQNLPELHHFNQARLLDLKSPSDPSLLEQALRQLLLHHDALRLRLVQEQSGWKQFNAEPQDDVPFVRVDLSGTTKPGQQAAMSAAIAELQASLNLADGPLLRMACFDLGPDEAGRLLIVVHHLAIDGVSWRILLEDLRTTYEQLEQGDAIVLPAKTTSFKQWSELLSEYAHSGMLDQELGYWLADERRQINHLPVDHASAENCGRFADTVSVMLSAEDTQALLQKVPAAYGTEINDVLLTALIRAFTEWTRDPWLLVDLEGHGREEIIEGVNLTRTVGWFTTIFPVLLKVNENTAAGEALKAIKQQLRLPPNRGIGYGLLRYLTGNAKVSDVLGSFPQPEVSFNYLGQFGQDHSHSSMFSQVADSPGLTHSPLQPRNHLLEVNGWVADGQLRLDWIYSKSVHRRETIQTLANRFVSALQLFITHCQSPEALAYAPSDFPDVELSQAKLDALLAEIGLG